MRGRENATVRSRQRCHSVLDSCSEGEHRGGLPVLGKEGQRAFESAIGLMVKAMKW
jgi:hypothetical protein